MPDFEEIVLGGGETGRKSGLAIALIVFTVYALLYRGPAEGYWDTYIAAPAVLLAGDTVEFLDENGGAGRDYQLAGKLPDDLVSKANYGIATKDQRLGPAVAAAPLYQLFGHLGFRLYHALFPALTAFLFFLFIHRLTGLRAVAFIAAGLLLLNPFVLSYQRMNAGFPALMLVAAIFVMLEMAPLRSFVTGLLLGALGAIRNEAIIFMPVILAWVFRRGAEQIAEGSRSRKRVAGLKEAAVMCAGALIVLLPFLYWKDFAFGFFLSHPSQYAYFEGFRPTFTHSFLGLEFQFNGLLNYPFADSVVRTPHFPFPNFLGIPLVLIRSFGILLFAVSLLGLGQAFAKRRRIASYMVAWFVINYLFWAFQENWEELKMSFVFFSLPPMLFFMAYGLERISAIADFKRNLIAIGSVAVVLLAILKFSFYLDFHADSRWYERFPKAATNFSGLSGLPTDRRLDPEFFLTRESPQELIEQKDRMTQACFLPCSYLPIRPQVSDLVERLSDEVGRKGLSVQGIWNLIYAQNE